MENSHKNLPINRIPFGILRQLKANQIVLMSSQILGREVWGSTTFDAYSWRPLDGLARLAELREFEEVHSITLSTILLNNRSIHDATIGLQDRFRIAAELEALLRHYRDVLVTYVVTHVNWKPMDEMTVFIGGDCYRTGAEIKDLETVLQRTKHLARAMLRKSVMVFPKVSALHGGKKGEWIITDGEGNRIDGLSDEAVVALGTLIIPKGITFLNDYKEKRAKARKLVSSFPKRNYVRSDTASPDVFSGRNWKNMCELWHKRRFDLSYVTCLPESLEGPLLPSSIPTAYGVVATACKLTHHYFQNRQLEKLKFLVEALGGVGMATVKALLERGCRRENITAFDKSAEACERAENEYGIRAINVANNELYRQLEPSDSYDVWINNGEGDNTTPEHVEALIRSGVRIFCGGANNLFQQTTKAISLERIFGAGCWAWPDEAANGGGFVLAVIDLLTRAKGLKSNSTAVRDQILETIVGINEKLVDEIVGALSSENRLSGSSIWRKVEKIIDKRVASATSYHLRIPELLLNGDVTRWKLI